jgi:hypothetical protein
MFFQFGFQALEQREGIGRRAREPGDNFVVRQAAHFARIGFQHLIAEGYLAVAGDDDLAVLAHSQNGCAVPGFRIMCAHKLSPRDLIPWGVCKPLSSQALGDIV